MKKLLTLLLISPLAFAETYMCDDEIGSFALKRTEYSFADLVQFTYQRNDEAPEIYTITNETNDHIYLMRDLDGGASNFIIGKQDNTFTSVYLKYKNSSSVFDGKCFELK